VANKQVPELQTAKTASHSSGSPLNVLADTNRKNLDRRIQRALDLLERTPVGHPLRIAEIAAELNLSPSHLRHLFRREVGISPTHYLKLLWLRKAKELLETKFPFC
jgi:transcriptional regulator GlxA family with amidase domain